jgi:hypothetical protein
MPGQDADRIYRATLKQETGRPVIGGPLILIGMNSAPF